MKEGIDLISVKTALSIGGINFSGVMFLAINTAKTTPRIELYTVASTATQTLSKKARNVSMKELKGESEAMMAPILANACLRLPTRATILAQSKGKVYKNTSAKAANTSKKTVTGRVWLGLWSLILPRRLTAFDLGAPC